jgi:hypothetical protein
MHSNCVSSVRSKWWQMRASRDDGWPYVKECKYTSTLYCRYPCTHISWYVSSFRSSLRQPT